MKNKTTKGRKTAKIGKKALSNKATAKPAVIRAGATAKGFSVSITPKATRLLTEKAKMLGYDSPDLLARSIIDNGLRVFNA